jgi:hypothetical protein
MSHSIQRIGRHTPPQWAFHNSFHLGKGSPPKRDTGSSPAHFLGPSHYQVKHFPFVETRRRKEQSTKMENKTKNKLDLLAFGILHWKHGKLQRHYSIVFFLSTPPTFTFKKSKTKKQSHFQPKPDKFLKSKIHGISKKKKNKYDCITTDITQALSHNRRSLID